MKKLSVALLVLGLAAIGFVNFSGWRVSAQNAPLANTTPVQPTQSIYYTIPFTATAAAGSAAVATIPAPAAGLYNYICYVGIEGSNNNTGAVLTNAVTTSSNFNSFALKFSQISANSNNYAWAMDMGDPSTGCVKSTASGTTTVFTSPTVANWAFSWTVTYFQAL